MINRNRGTYTVGLLGVNVEIDYNNDEAREFLDFLFGDLPRNDSPVSNRRFDILVVGKPARISLWQEEKQLYFGDSRHAMAYILVNEIIYECIVGNSENLALHAAAISHEGKGILLPGQSGSGKSSLAAWLTASGYTYLSDELVLVSGQGRIQPFTRPLSLTSSSFATLAGSVEINIEKCLTGTKGVIVPHRCLNPHWTYTTPALSTIIYPEFSEGQPATLTRMSSAQSCLKLLGCYVNARNIPGHGFSEVAELSRRTISYNLKFGSFDDILTALAPILSAGRQ